MTNYKIIADENKLKEFIEFLPELKNGEMYYVTLFARNKYDTTGVLKSDKAQLKRFTSNKQFLFQKIKQLECVYGAYLSDNNIIPQESLAVYISINPRSLLKASRDLLIELAHKVTSDYTGYNPQALALSCIQNARGSKHYMDMDFDKVNLIDLQNQIDESKINKSCIRYIQTRGGVHLLVKLDEIESKYTKSWFQHLSSLPGYDKMSKAELVPVPGCVQGGFTPVLY